MESDRSDSFSAPQNLESTSNSGGRVLIGIAEEPTDASTPKPVDKLPSDTPKVEELKSVEHTVAIANGGDSAQPEDRAINTTQESNTRVSSPALMTQPFPSIPKVAEQGGYTGKPSEEDVVDAHSGSNNENEHFKEEKEPKMEDFKDVRNEAKPALLPSTSSTPRVKGDSRGKDIDTNEPSAHLVIEDEPHPAKKRSDTGVISVISVRDFGRVVCSVLYRCGCADQSRLLCSSRI